MMDMCPSFHGLFTIAQISHIHSLSCSAWGVFQYFTKFFHACIRQVSNLAMSPLTFDIFLHFCLVELKCSCKYLSIVKCFNGGSIMKIFARSPWMASIVPLYAT